MAQSREILVLGSTGQTGRIVADSLERERHTVRRASRSSASTPFDWFSPDTWRQAVEGVSRVYVVLPERLVDFEAFVDLLETCGVEYAVVLTARNPSVSGDAIAVGAEFAFAQSVVKSTFLQPSWFAQNFTTGMFAGQLQATGTLRLPTGTGSEPFIDYRDIADVASSILAMDDPSPSGPLPLSGPKSYAFEEALRVLADVTGTGAGKFEPISVDEWQAEATRAGIPETFVKSLSNLFVAISKGRDDYISNGVYEVLGREPRSLPDTFRDHSNATS
ncbi:dTDP-4-dehydrorhamnose reductase [Rhodococcus erythropolis]|uniref:dTDP-4-dehydrorhamnose reductase n=1 Tax=Rhodococcus erythropolis TaxID=1833 RepID=UPI003D0F9497